MQKRENTANDNHFIFDANKCVACGACLLACQIENGTQANALWRNVYESNSQKHPEIPIFYLSMACNHCQEPLCLKNCPALAYSQDKKTGAILHNEEKCIGCSYCTWACPYNAPKFSKETGTVQKCTFCNTVILEDGIPACANACPTGALRFSNKKQENIKLKPIEKFSIKPRLHYISKRNKKPAKYDEQLFSKTAISLEKQPESKISVSKEWPLLIFTFLTTFIVASYSVPFYFMPVDKIFLILIFTIAAFFSIFHLGKKKRAFRSLLNVRDSWLSREILLFGIFFSVIILDFSLCQVPNIVFCFCGLFLLISIDMLYFLAHANWPINVHSGQTILIGLTSVAFFLQEKYFLIVLVIIRMSLSIYWLKNYKTSTDKVVSFVRITLLMALPYFVGTGIFAWAIFLVGEVLDRALFYSNLTVRNLHEDLLK